LRLIDNRALSHSPVTIRVTRAHPIFKKFFRFTSASRIHYLWCTRRGARNRWGILGERRSLDFVHRSQSQRVLTPVPVVRTPPAQIARSALCGFATWLRELRSFFVFYGRNCGVQAVSVAFPVQSVLSPSSATVPSGAKR